MRKEIYLLPLGILASCSVGPEYKSPQMYNDEVIKQELQLKKNYKIPVNWYEQLADTQLNKIVESGIKHSTDISKATARLKQARANLRISKVQGLPMIDGRGGYSYEKNSRNIGTVENIDYFNIGFDASWELDIWGKYRRQSEADKAISRQMEYRLDDIKTMVVSEIVLNYVNLMMSIKKLQIAKRNVALQNNIFQTVKAKYESGLADDIAYNQAQYLLSTTQARIPELKSDIEAYKNSLSTLSGVLPSAIIIDKKYQSPLFSRQYNYHKEMVYNLPADIIRRRPDVAAAEQNLIAKNALIGKAVAQLYPDVSLSAMWGYASGKGSNLFNNKSQSYSYEPIISIPLLDWNRLKNNVELSKYQKEEALAQYQQTVLGAVSEIKNAMIGFQNEIKSNQSHKNALNKMQSVVASTNTRYQNGLLEFSELLDREQDLLVAQDRYVESQAEIFRELVAYYKASGGGYLR